jgi:ComF family protein
MFICAIYNLFFPKICGACSKLTIKFEDELCLRCELQLLNLAEPNANKIAKELKGRVEIEKGVYLFDFSKKERVQEILHSIKYKKNKKLGSYIAEQMARKLGDFFFEDVDILLPIPLHPKKEKIRGYNQAELIAKGIYKFIPIEINLTSLKRTIFTDSQTNKNRMERWENVQNAFEVRNKKKLDSKHILLIDDVFTTGATLEACIKTLKREVNCKYSILTIARA